MKIVSRILIVMVIVGLCSFAIHSCQKSEKETGRKFEKLVNHLNQDHKLRKMFDYTEKTKIKNSDWHAGGGFFLLLGGFSAGGDSQEKEERRAWIMFAWEDADNTYISARIPFLKTRVHIVNDIEVPTVNFHLYGESRPHSQIEMLNWFYCDTQTFFDRYLAYAVINVSEKDWPVNIRLPLNDSSIFKNLSE